MAHEPAPHEPAPHEPAARDPAAREPAAREPAKALQDALARMRWRVEPARFALFGFAESPSAEDLASIGEGPGQIVREGGETTLLVGAERAAEVLARHPGAAVERDLCWIRFELPMDWELVGFLALVTGRLAAEGVPLGAVCAYSRDHLFVAEPHLARAAAALDLMFPRS